MQNQQRKTITKTVCIDSLFRDNYNETISSDFMCTLPQSIHNVTSMRLVMSEIPYTWYTFSEAAKNNSFTVKIFNFNVTDSSFQTFKITIPDGNYLSDDLETTINNMFLNIGNGLDLLLFKILERSGKCCFRLRNNNDIIPLQEILQLYEDTITDDFYYELYFHLENPTQPLHKNAGWALGFTYDSYKVYSGDITNYSDSNIATLKYYYYIEGESTYGNGRLNYFFIDVDDYNNHFTSDTIVSKLNSAYLGKNILARISVDNGANAIITTDNSGAIKKQRDYHSPVTINKLHVRLLDKYGQLLQLNNNDYSLVFEMDVLL
jgi:hypothetical protein